MRNAEKWLLKELAELGFEPYAGLLPAVAEQFAEIRKIEAQFRDRIGNRLTKRQAVGLGLLARTYQLSVSCLVNQLMQNYAGWTCSYRSLLETFFVADWLSQESQRFEAYFEGRAPGIGRIKSASFVRYPELVKKYSEASQVTHISSRALHLPWGTSDLAPSGIPFTGTSMKVAGRELESMMLEFRSLLHLLVDCLHMLMIENFDGMCSGEVLWDGGKVKAKYGCLGYEPLERSGASTRKGS